MIQASELKWHCRWISVAAQYASWSKDNSTRVGAVVVKGRKQLTAGFNGFPEFVDDNDSKKWERPDKYEYIEHAERNALNQAALHGISLEGATLYLNYSPPPCSSCTRGIIQTHIHRIIGPSNLFPGKGDQWKHSLEIANNMLISSNIEVYRIPGYWRYQLTDNNNLEPDFMHETRPNYYILGRPNPKAESFVEKLVFSLSSGIIWEKESALSMEGPFIDFTHSFPCC